MHLEHNLGPLEDDQKEVTGSAAMMTTLAILMTEAPTISNIAEQMMYERVIHIMYRTPTTIESMIANEFVCVKISQIVHRHD